MVIVAVLASSLWFGAPLLPVVVVLLAFAHPLLAVAGAAAWAVISRMRVAGAPEPEDEVRILDRIVSELQGGASPRAALVAAARRERIVDLSAVERFVVAGLPAPAIAAELADTLPLNGRLVAAAWALAGETGAPAAPIMSLLAGRASERSRLVRERRALTAQARATAWLIAGLPLVVLLGLAVTGRIGPGPGLSVVMVGVALQCAGLAIVAVMMRGSAR